MSASPGTVRPPAESVMFLMGKPSAAASRRASHATSQPQFAGCHGAVRTPSAVVQPGGPAPIGTRLRPGRTPQREHHRARRDPVGLARADFAQVQPPAAVRLRPGSQVFQGMIHAERRRPVPAAAPPTGAATPAACCPTGNTRPLVPTYVSTPRPAAHARSSPGRTPPAIRASGRVRVAVARGERVHVFRMGQVQPAAPGDEEFPAHGRLALAQGDAPTAVGEDFGGAQARRAAADDEGVRVDVRRAWAATRGLSSERRPWLVLRGRRNGRRVRNPRSYLCFTVLALPENVVHVWTAALDDPAPGGLLDADETARAARFHFERDRRHYAAARGWLRLAARAVSRHAARRVAVRLRAARQTVPRRSVRRGVFQRFALARPRAAGLCAGAGGGHRRWKPGRGWATTGGDWCAGCFRRANRPNSAPCPPTRQRDGVPERVDAQGSLPQGDRPGHLGGICSPSR